MLTYQLICPNEPYTVVTMDYGGAYCFDANGLWDGGYAQAIAVSNVVSSPALSAADIGVLLSAALAIFAMAWGFKMIGKLLFKDA